MQRQENVGNQTGKLRRDGISSSTRAGESSPSTSRTSGMNCLSLITHTLPTPKLLPSQSTNEQGATHTPYQSAVLVSHMGSLKRSKTPAGSSAPPWDPILEAHKCHLVLDDNRMYVCLGSFLPSFLISSFLKICFRGRISNRFHAQQGAWLQGLISRPETTTCAKTKSHSTDWARQVPLKKILNQMNKNNLCFFQMSSVITSQIKAMPRKGGSSLERTS